MPLGSKAGAKFSVGALAPPLSKHAGPRGSRQPENGVNRSPGHPPRPHSIQSGPLAAEAAPPPPTASAAPVPADFLSCADGPLSCQGCELLFFFPGQACT